MPFLLAGPGFATRELEEHVEAGETWRVLEVIYPAELFIYCWLLLVTIARTIISDIRKMF